MSLRQSDDELERAGRQQRETVQRLEREAHEGDVDIPTEESREVLWTRPGHDVELHVGEPFAEAVDEIPGERMESGGAGAHPEKASFAAVDDRRRPRSIGTSPRRTMWSPVGFRRLKLAGWMSWSLSWRDLHHSSDWSTSGGRWEGGRRRRGS